MKPIRNNSRWIAGMLGVLALMVGGGSASAVEVRGTLKLKGNTSVFGLIQYLPGRVYVLRDKNTERQYPSDQVLEVIVPDPPELVQALAKVNAGQGASAEGTLKKIMSEYAGFTPASKAAAGLAKSYMQANKKEDAIKICETLIRSDPKAMTADLAYQYWELLLQMEKYVDLERALNAAIEAGSRDVAAVAQMKRGDMLKRKGDIKAALVDGYLRAVYFYKSYKEVRAEALYKGAKCFEELNQIQNAERLRKILLTEYPEDPYSKRAKDGA